MIAADEDIVIIGGGVIGLTCAYQLSRHGLHITVLEKGICGDGASGAATGILWPPSPLNTGVFHELHRASLIRFPEFARHLEAHSGISTGFRVCGGIEIFPTEHQQRTAERKVSALPSSAKPESPLTPLTPDQVAQLEPAVLRTQFGGLQSPSCAVISPTDFITALATACRRNGVQLQEHCAVRALMMDQGRVVGVETENGFIPANRVLVTAGCGTPNIDPILAMYAPVVPVKGQAITVRTDRRFLRGVVRWKRILTWQPAPEYIMIGSTTEFDVGHDDRCTDEARRELMAKTEEVLPMLAGAAVERQWVGFRPATFDRAPYIGAIPGISGLFVASGHYKVGLALAPITAEIMASLILHGEFAPNLTPLQPRRQPESGKR